MPRKSNRIQAALEGSPEWYASPAGRRAGLREFEKALRDGTLQLNPKGLPVRPTNPKILEQLMAQAAARVTKPVSLRLPIADIEHARRIAAAKRVGYQTVLKDAIRLGLAQS